METVEGRPIHGARVRESPLHPARDRLRSKDAVRGPHHLRQLGPQENIDAAPTDAPGNESNLWAHDCNAPLRIAQ